MLFNCSVKAAFCAGSGDLPKPHAIHRYTVFGGEPVLSLPPLPALPSQGCLAREPLGALLRQRLLQLPALLLRRGSCSHQCRVSRIEWGQRCAPELPKPQCFMTSPMLNGNQKHVCQTCGCTSWPSYEDVAMGTAAIPGYTNFCSCSYSLIVSRALLTKQRVMQGMQRDSPDGNTPCSLWSSSNDAETSCVACPHFDPTFASDRGVDAVTEELCDYFDKQQGYGRGLLLFTQLHDEVGCTAIWRGVWEAIQPRLIGCANLTTVMRRDCGHCQPGPYNVRSCEALAGCDATTNEPSLLFSGNSLVMQESYGSAEVASDRTVMMATIGTPFQDELSGSAWGGTWPACLGQVFPLSMIWPCSSIGRPGASVSFVVLLGIQVDTCGRGCGLVMRCCACLVALTWSSSLR